ncbi:hypothetical protein GNP92_15045 [Paenibacillus timonensis]|nr:hypothetical protein [Paenibacillus timonensis]MUG87658.1 hypothetical protein [Paenibacillus timonensis]
MELTTLYTPTDIDFTNGKTITESAIAQANGWNAYLDDVKQAEIDPLLQQMHDAKHAYFTALADLKERAHEIANESTKRQDHVIQQYAPGAHIASLDVSYAANRDAYISASEVAAQKVIY